MEGISETVDSSCSFSGNRGVSHQADKEVPASSGVCTPRPDGRSSGMELRPVSVQLGLIKNADGSARISQGFTTVTSIVLGPLEAPLGPKCLSSTCYFHVIVRSVGSLPVRSQRISSGGSLLTGRDPLSSLSSSSSWKSSSLDQKTEWERSMECQLHALLQHMVIGAKYPRSLVQVSLLISQDDGCLESVCINAALASLLDAGIGLRYRAWSIGLVHLMVEETRDKLISSRDKEKKKEEEEGERKQETEWMLDPCREEEEDGRTEGEKIFVLEPQTGDLVSSFFKRQREPNRSALPRRQAHAMNSTDLGTAQRGLDTSYNRYAICEAGMTIPGGGALDFSSNELDDVFARGLGAVRIIDRYVRYALRKKMESACLNFEYSNFWWVSSSSSASRA